MDVHGWNDSGGHSPLLYPLYEPVMVGMDMATMVFRGFQRPGAANDKSVPTYAQE